MPECVREIAYEHWHRYAWAEKLVQGRRVLDAACGEGYGSYFLSGSAQSVVGIDIDASTIDHACRRYQAENLTFTSANALNLPFADKSFDVVVCFETLEHLEDHDVLLSEFKRVLVTDGCLILSSPNKATYRDQANYDNPFHVRELYQNELENLLSRHFSNYVLWAQKLNFVSSIWPLNCESTSNNDKSHRWLTLEKARVDETQWPKSEIGFFLAIASMSDLSTDRRLSLFTDSLESVYQHYNAEIRHHIESGALLAEKEREIEELKFKLALPWRRVLRKIFGQ